MSESTTFENVLPIRELDWLLILAGRKIKGINELEEKRI